MNNYSSLNILLDNVEGTNLLLEYYSDFSKRIFGAKDFKSIVSGLYEELRKIYFKQTVEFILWQNEKELVKFLYDPKTGEVSPSKDFTEKNSLYHYVLEERQTVLTNNYPNFCENLGLVDPNLQANAWLGIPMRVRGKILGMIAIWDKNPEHFFRLQDKQFLSIVTYITGFAIENISIFEYLAEKQDSINLDNTVFPQLPASGDVDDFTHYFLQTLLHRTDINYAGLFLRSQSHDKWRLVNEAHDNKIFENLEKDLRKGLIYLKDENLKDRHTFVWIPQQGVTDLDRVFEDIRENYSLKCSILSFCAIQHYYFCVLVVVLDTDDQKGIQKNLPYIEFTFSLLSQLIEKNILQDHKKNYESYIQHLEKLKIVGELASSSAHHLNNILSVISGRTQILLKKLKESSYYKDIKMIEQASADGALAVRRLQSVRTHGDKKKKYEILNVNDLILEVIEIVRPRFEREAQSTGITYDVKLTLGSFSSVKCDPAALREVFLNVINNAFDAMPKGGKLTIQTTLEKQKVFIFVSDTGQGIPEEVREKIFEPFFSTKGDGGNGLGLSIAAEIIANHQGKIYVDSIPKKGSIFMIELPAADEEPASTPPQSPPSEDFVCKVLLVDDENAVGETLAEMLRGEGYEVVTVNDAKEAVMKFVKSDCDLVLTDLSMPGINGYELAKRIKSLKKNIPVILITGWNQERDNIKDKNEIIDGLIEKPFDLNQIKQEFRKVLKGNGYHK
jgi:signal transduction histidine kinase